MENRERKLRVMLVSMVPPRNDCGVRIVMYRHLVERAPFDLHVASTADFADGLLIDTKLELPCPVQKIKKSRFGPALRKWIQDFENFVWPLLGSRQLERAVDEFQPDIILTLAETGLCHIAAKVAKRRGIPLAVLFLDWFPIMDWHYGHRWTQPLLSRRFRRLYNDCDLAICTSDGMKEVLGPHPNSHVVYPMPGERSARSESGNAGNARFTLLYVGRAEGSYGRALADLMQALQHRQDVAFRIIAPALDWPADQRKQAEKQGVYLGFKPPLEAAPFLESADALLVVMPFEPSEKLFMQTSFTTKFLDYSAFGKPILLWGPEYCCPVQLVHRCGGALLVTDPAPSGAAQAVAELAASTDLRHRLGHEALSLSQSVFDPDRLQSIFVTEISKLAKK
jgi:glycosyltransferase involved in cell wall biosynthesis